MANVFLNFKYGESANFTKEKIPVNPGTIYITTDEKRMYVDLGEERYRIGDFETYDSFEALKADSKNWTSSTLAYIKEGNTLAKYDKTTNEWIQINDTSMLKKSLEGEISAVEEKVTELQSTVGGHAKEISDIKDKLGLGDSTSGESTLTARVQAVEKDIETLQSEQSTQNEAISAAKGQADKGVADAAEAKKAADTNRTSISDLTTTVANNKTDIENKLTEQVTALKGTDKDVSSADTIAGAKKYADEKIAVALQSADAMTFRGVLGDDELTVLPIDGVQAGDTYKVGVSGKYLGDNTTQYVGDLIIAKGDQPLTDLEYKGGWYHISSGYEDDYDSYFKFENGVVKIYGGDGQSDGSITIKAAEGSGVTVTSNAIGNGDVTSPSQATFNIGFTWGTF